MPVPIFFNSLRQSPCSKLVASSLASDLGLGPSPLLLTRPLLLVGLVGSTIAADPGRVLGNFPNALGLSPDAGDRLVIDAEQLGDDPVRLVRRFCKLVGDDLSFLLGRQLPPGQVQGTGERPHFFRLKIISDDLGTVVAHLVSDLLAVAAVDDETPRTAAVRDDRHLDAENADTVPKALQLILGQREGSFRTGL